MTNLQSAVVRGAVAGAAGTAAMTLMMRKVAPKLIPEDMRPDEFVPKKAVEWTEAQVGRPDALSESQAMRAAMAAHFAYGSGSGAVYGVLRSRVGGLPAPVTGAIFGVALWAASFEGWLPALGVMPAPTEQPPKKVPMPLLAHIVYGVTTALAYEALDGVLE